MELISLQEKTSFLEEMVVDYQKAGVMNPGKEEEATCFCLDADV
eukprot:CAMPEP_0195036204 /NCGR_PEP_ID=MMETSP0326_2-20130528/71936_1 /TAXON_ID=2866 ORGANISM="Crypthecodinium cohnii, Strain Seligo" /NCGR_SAMPLE_ID=MMETSP0326_2 /ASSEMBLY_ACC=CAM_ASM_000348 /LENGTH=43 /DNA_ID= /DNA_START= /DNA_END= /DNA_ORIENTATION=